MPHQLLRDGQIVADEWTYFAPAASGDESALRRLILTHEQWIADKSRWLAAPERLGLVIVPAFKIETLAPDLPRFDLIAAEFPGPSEGRGYSQARLLRERYQFRGELRAIGYVRPDQVFFLARCGFNSFEMNEPDIAEAGRAFHTFTAEYQPSNDDGLAQTLQKR